MSGTGRPAATISAAWNRLSARFAELLRFGTVGVLTALIYAAIVWLAVEEFRAPSELGVGIAYVLAVTFNYLAHHMWTFRSDRPHRSTGPRYLLVMLVILATNVAATAWLPGLLGVSYVVVQIGLAAVAAVCAFAAQAAWVFRR